MARKSRIKLAAFPSSLTARPAEGLATSLTKVNNVHFNVHCYVMEKL